MRSFMMSPHGLSPIQAAVRKVSREQPYWLPNPEPRSTCLVALDVQKVKDRGWADHYTRVYWVGRLGLWIGKPCRLEL